MYHFHHVTTNQMLGVIMATFRGFIAIDVPVNEQLQDVLDSLKKTSAHIKLVEPENIHITLKFLGDTPEEHINTIEQIIHESVQTTSPFTMKLKGMGVFPNERYIKVLWVGIQHAEPLKPIMEMLNEKLAHLGFQKEKKSFSPHLTIGRMKSATGKEEVLDILYKHADTIFSEIPVTTIKLKQSLLTPTGPIYSTKKEIKLKT